MKYVLHPASERGTADHGWLKTAFSFSFAQYYNPSKMGFGALRVLNDDHIEGGQGFGKHPHDNMEIITIPLFGDLKHADSMGNEEVIKEGEIQVMSAGTGIFHSEFNANADKAVKLLQIWVYPREKNVAPRYEQIMLPDLKTKGVLHQVVSPNPSDRGVWIHQDAWFYIGSFDKNQKQEHSIQKTGNGVFAFVIDGTFEVEGHVLEGRDAVGIWELDRVRIDALQDNSRILLIEVPMSWS